MAATQEQIDGLREANASLEHALTNCRRAVRGERPLSPAAASPDFDGLAQSFGDLFGGSGIFGRGSRS
jgi:hypothetical protein